MAVNKVIYGGETLIDLTGDTVKEDKILKGYTAHGADGEKITGTCEYDANTQDATATDAEILKDKIAYVRGNKVKGAMTNNGAVNEMISAKEQEIIIAQGYHDGSGKVAIDPAEAKKLIPENIRAGITILDVEGNMSGSEDVKAQSGSARPKVTAETYTPDEGFNYFGQFTVEAIPYVESDNSAGGKTVTIG